MKIIPVQSPGQIPTNGTPESVRTAKAVAAFNKGASSYDKQAPQQSTAQEHPVLNPNQVSVEELGAIQAQVAEEIDKNGTNVDEVSSEEVKETQIEAKQAEKPKEDPELTRQFANLARQERALRAKTQQEQQKLNEAKAQLEAKEAALQAKIKQQESGYISVEEFKADPFGVMEKTGLTYEELTQRALNQQPKDPRVEATISRLEAKIRALEEQAETSTKSYQQQQQDQYTQAVKQIELDAKSLIKSDPVTYEAIAKTGSIKDVVELITETFNKDGVLLTVEEAAQQVEDYLVEEGYKTVSTIDKIKKRMQANGQPASSQKQTPKNQQTQTMKTLTNASSSQRQLSAKERAILAFNGQLKS